VPTATRAMKNGAVDFLTKPFDDEELILAVKRALERAEEQLRRRAERQEARRRIEKLTPREFEVLRFVVIGLLNKQIAACDVADKLATSAKPYASPGNRDASSCASRRVPAARRPASLRKTKVH
jgi:FixJ family two-component response regulator